MRDVVKTNVKREQNSKRVRRRKKKLSVYIFLIFLLVTGIGILLSVTLLFNINKINVNGDVDYSDETVLEASGLEKGDNLVRLDTKKAEQKILSSMVYIEEANISKKYPDTLEINLTKCVPLANVAYEEGYLLISKKGKILENVKQAQAGCFTIKGLDPSISDLGKYLQSEDEQKTKMYQEILEFLGKYDDQNVVSVDMTDKYAVVINYDNRINFELGNSNDISYKLKLANTVLKDIDETKKGTMVMVGANQISFRSEGGGFGTADKKPDSDRVAIDQEDLPEGYTEAVTGYSNGDDYIEDQNYDNEYIYDQEESYVEDEPYNNEEYYDEPVYYDDYAEDENAENYDYYAE